MVDPRGAAGCALGGEAHGGGLGGFGGFGLVTDVDYVWETRVVGVDGDELGVGGFHPVGFRVVAYFAVEAEVVVEVVAEDFELPVY